MKPPQLWFARPKDADFPVLGERFMPVLTPEERARHHGFHRASDRDLYFLAHSLMRAALLPQAESPMSEWVLTRGEKGKPRIDLGLGNAPEFSSSHTAGMAVCGVSASGRIGIDVEPANRGRDALEIAARWFTESEHLFIEGLSPHLREEAAIWTWTAKEALLKATGEGIGSLSSFSVRWPTQDGDVLTVNTESPWTLLRFRLGSEFLGAIAQEGSLTAGLLPEAFQMMGSLETPRRASSIETNGVVLVEVAGKR